jgi:hypothetical protein
MQDKPERSSARPTKPSLEGLETGHKNQYSTPRLVKYGSFPKLTQGMASGVSEGGSMSPCL